jgi:hypothetical protein
MRIAKRFTSMILAVSLVAMIVSVLPRPAAADDSAASSIFTDDLPTIDEVVDESGFKHPGVGLTKEILENLQTEVRAQKEPWISYFNQMLLSNTASKTVTSSNQSGSDPTKPGTDAFNSQGVESKFISDALKAYTQSLLYVITGDEAYRANALHIIRIWSQMDPAKYAYYTDAHIHAGIPLYRMVTAAEILRYTSTPSADLQWTDQDTADFANNLITPCIETLLHKNSYFMNQHLYPLIGAMSGYIFTGNKARYDEGVEWFTVNRTAVDQGQNGSIRQLFRLVDTNDLTGEKVENPQVQIVEMGRDQAHSTGDVVNASILSRLLLAQGTKVDPVAGTVSTAADAVTTYDFLGKRILQGADYYARYMLGYDTPWIPTAAHTDADGHPTLVYQQLNTNYRGRIGGNVYDLYYYYKYSEGMDMEQAAPYFSEMFAKRLPFWWESPDAGGEYWLYIPPAAEAEGTAELPQTGANPNHLEIEDRYTKFDSNSTTVQEGDVSFVRVTATEAGSKIAFVGSANGARTVAFKIRTNGTAKLEAFGDTITLPDTKGQWRYVYVAFNDFQGLGDLAYFTVLGNGTIVDLDHINVNAANELTPPAFTAGNDALDLFGYAGSDAAVHYDFSATDSGASDSVTYQIDNAPEGAAFDADTGAFDWKPAQAGTYSFVVGASDGATVTAREVNVTVAPDRQSALDAVNAGYDPQASYVQSTLDRYRQAYQEALDALPAATDDVFYQKLTDLNDAIRTLQLLTPLLADGSMNYLGMLSSSTFGTEVARLLDNSPDTFAGYYLAQNLSYVMDFGPSFRVSASKFQLQVRAGFPERIGGVAVFGSDDMDNWTRLTPDTTQVTQDMQTLAVPAELQNESFRFLKIQMIEPRYDLFSGSPMIELSEFHISGERHEVVNKLSNVSIGSDQSLHGRIVLGDTVKLQFQSTEPIRDVQVRIQGEPATVRTDDQSNWTAEAVMESGAAVGKVTFELQYRTAAGDDAALVQVTTDGSSLVLADESDLIQNVTGIAGISDSSGRTPEDAKKTAAALFDGDPGSITDYRVNGGGSGGYVVFDFQEGSHALLTSVELLARQDGYFGRIGGTVIQGSNDNATWTTLTPAAAGISDWQTLKVNDSQPYRYIRIYNAGNWFGNMSEVRFHGTVQSSVKVASVSIRSDQAVRNRIAAGDTVELAFTATEPIQGVAVRIQDQDAAVASDDHLNWTAEAVVSPEAASGAVVFNIRYQTEDGEEAPDVASTSDGSSLFIADESDLLRHVVDTVDLSDSSGRSPADLYQTASALFDGNPGTITDFRVNGSGYGGWIAFDFKEGRQAALSNVEILARQDRYASRIKGAVVQGSNDKATWTTISSAAASTDDWQTLTIQDSTPYRYIRIFNGNNWFGNMAELRLHGEVQDLDITPPTTTDDAVQEWVRTDAQISLQAADEQSGVAATYYTVDDGERQTGNSVTLTAEGTHQIVYWSVDQAGNAEEPHAITVRIDKTAPTLAIRLDPESIWPPNHKMVTVHADPTANDEASGIASVTLTSVTCDQPDSGDGDIAAEIGTDATSFQLRAEKSRIYTVTYTATDKAGNQTVGSATVTVPHDQSGKDKQE